MITLDKLKIGQSALIKTVGGEGARRQHFLDMGVIPDAIVKLVKFAPLGDRWKCLSTAIHLRFASLMPH